MKSYSVIAFTFIQKTKKTERQKKKWGSELDQNQGRIDSLLVSLFLARIFRSTLEVNNVILDPGFIKDGEDKGQQLEN